MSGPEGDRGVNTRALDELFQRTQARKDSHVDHIAVSVLEVGTIGNNHRRALLGCALLVQPRDNVPTYTLDLS